MIPIDVDGPFVIARLEEAVSTLRAMRVSRCTPAGIGSGWPDMLRDPEDVAYVTTDDERPHVETPSNAAISRMDEALPWVNLIRADLRFPNHGGCLLRKIVLLRAVVSFRTGREVWSWKRLEGRFNRSREMLRRDHDTAVFVITTALKERT